MTDDMKSLMINGEPYLYVRLTKPYFIYTDVSHTKYTVGSPGEYLILDRHFNANALTEAQMEKAIAEDFKRYRRDKQEDSDAKDIGR